MATVVFYFQTNTDTMLATKALRDAGVAAKMIPAPQDLASSANLCLKIDESAEQSALTAIRSTQVSLGGVLR